MPPVGPRPSSAAARCGAMAIPVQQPYAVIRTVGAAAVPPVPQPRFGGKDCLSHGGELGGGSGFHGKYVFHLIVKTHGIAETAIVQCENHV